MGVGPDKFNGDRSKADRFIDGVEAYFMLNFDVPGFDSPMKKIAYTLDRMEGEEIEGWKRDMGTWFRTLVPAQDNFPFI